MTGARTVEFPMASQREVLLGLRRSQVVLAVCWLAGALFVASRGSLPFEMAAVVILVVGAISVSARVGGRGIDQWIPVLARFGLDGLLRLEHRPIHRNRRRGRSHAERAAIEAVGSRGGAGVIINRGFLSVVMEVHGGGLALLGDADRVERVDGFRNLLDAAAAALPPGSTLQFLVEIDRLSGAVEEMAFDTGAFAFDDTTYEARLRHQGVSRRSYLALHLRVPRSTWGTGSIDHEETIENAYRVLATAASSSGITIDPLMSPDALRELPLLAPWLQGCRSERFDTVISAGRVHSTAWIESLPTRPTEPGFMDGLLISDSPMVLSLLCRPIPHAKAERGVEAARVAQAANATLALRGGFLRNAKTRRHDVQLELREDDIAAGHATFAVTAYLRITATDRTALASDMAIFKQRASSSGLKLIFLNGDQRRALRCTLPLGVGVR